MAVTSSEKVRATFKKECKSVSVIILAGGTYRGGAVEEFTN